MSEEQAARGLGPSLPVSGEPGQLLAESGPGVPPGASATAPSRTSSSGAADETYLQKFVSETHSYITQYIQNADQKAVFLFGVAAALLAFLHQDGASGRWLRPRSEWVALSWVTLVAMLALAAAAVTAVAVIVPRLPGKSRGVVSFLGIAAYASKREYADSLLRTSAPVLLAEKAEHCHILASICAAKYNVLRVAVLCEAIGVVAAVAYLLFARA